MNEALMPREAKVYQFVASELKTKNIAPTCREIAAACGMYASSVHVVLDRLQDKGYIKRLPNRHRSIELVPLEDFVRLSYEVLQIVTRYSKEHETTRDVAACELIRFGSASV